MHPQALPKLYGNIYIIENHKIYLSRCVLAKELHPEGRRTLYTHAQSIIYRDCPSAPKRVTGLTPHLRAKPVQCKTNAVDGCWCIRIAGLDKCRVCVLCPVKFNVQHVPTRNNT